MELKILIDPLDENLSPKFNYRQMTEACGIIPHWIRRLNHASIKERLLESYPYFSGEMVGGALHRDGTYTYPEDPDLFPLMSFESDTEICFIYVYGIVGIFNKEDGTTWVTRMD